MHAERTRRPRPRRQGLGAEAEDLVERIERTAMPVGTGLGAGRVDLAASLGAG